jgi:hypothetical protein
MTTIFSETIESQTAWRGPQLAQTNQWIYRLSKHEVDEINFALAKAKSTGKQMHSLTQADFPLSNMLPVIKNWSAELSNGRGFILIKGFPVEQHSAEDIGLAYYGLGLYLGKAVPQNAAGDLLGHVRDIGSPDPNVRLYQSNKRQDFHCDGSDLVGLLSLQRAKRGGLSRIVSSVSIYNEIIKRRPDLIERLYQPFYFDLNNEEPAGAPPYFELPICNNNNGRLRFFYIGWYIRNAQRHSQLPRLTDSELELLNLIEEIANNSEFYLDMDFEVGDIQFLNNVVILHSRSEYEDYNEPARKRHLLRLWLTAHDFSSVEELLHTGIRQK